MEVNDDRDDARETALSLRLNYDGGSSHLSTGDHPRPQAATPVEPSLTLGLPSTACSVSGVVGRMSSSHSVISSISGGRPSKAKRENDGRISDEEEDGAARKKLRLTKEQSALLEDKFKEHATLNTKQKQALARQLNLRPRQVEVWFQNRRARTKLKKTEVECEFLRKCCETLREENRRLLQEIQDLKSLDFQAPRYMQPPRGAAAAATFQTCPSCKNRGEGGSPAAAPKTRFFNPFAHSAAN
ncbi:homeobox-leucine zipper protein [Musa troglodytarum]|uniref:Homeobox-leucine zipper protein n=1 Tax=Musa troglodytarum TaxID=320322 RepID=A0A9E7H9S9_9LILI|nr:homeobox-leucine zipper protein [Musa troglodytarum]URE29263.1 homeobox-leucine zipper protein [Musa troglodytarum]